MFEILFLTNPFEQTSLDVVRLLCREQGHYAYGPFGKRWVFHDSVDLVHNSFCFGKIYLALVFSPKLPRL